MKKYLIIGNAESPHLVKWVKELIRFYDVYVFSSQGVHPEIANIIPEEKIKCLYLNISESGGNLQFIKAILPLRKMIRQTKPDYVNPHYITSHGTIAALAGNFCKKKYILIQSAWGTDILVTPFRNRFYKSITRFALKKAQLATADSHAVEKIIHDLAGTKTLVFPFGLDRLPEVKFNEKDPDLFFSNRTLNANSNIDKAIHFFAKVHDQLPDARMIIANEGSEKENLVLLAKELGISDSVDFVGYISADEQNEIYKRARFYISILTSDALSVSLLEAMSFGCIPILSDLPDNRAWVNNGENGIILKDGTHYDAIINISKLASEIFIANRAKIEQGAIFPKAIKGFVQKLDKKSPKR